MQRARERKLAQDARRQAARQPQVVVPIVATRPVTKECAVILERCDASKKGMEPPVYDVQTAFKKNQNISRDHLQDVPLQADLELSDDHRYLCSIFGFPSEGCWFDTHQKFLPFPHMPLSIVWKGKPEKDEHIKIISNTAHTEGFCFIRLVMFGEATSVKGQASTHITMRRFKGTASIMDGSLKIDASATEIDILTYLACDTYYNGKMYNSFDLRFTYSNTMH